MKKTGRRIAGFGAAVALALLSIGGLSAPAYAWASNGATCGTTTEMCYVTLNADASYVAFSTNFNVSNPNATAYWSIYKGTAGATLCTGYMKYKASVGCNIGTYRGLVTAVFAKGQGNSGKVGIAS